ncbi:MAG: M23 family metallopeptidase [Prevotella sp.]|jgi:hypothetical protein|nr:M23 family metallopeptidase [Prevotella sp.]
MKRLIFILPLYFLFLVLPIYSQNNNQIIKFDFKWDDKGNLTIFAENNDCCPYHLMFHLPSPQGLNPVGGDRTEKVIERGRTEIMSLRRTQNYNVNPGRYSYTFYPGNPRLKPNLDYQYSLPIAKGDSLDVQPVQSPRYTQKFILKNVNDTIYASRAGIMCDYLSRKTETLTIYHKDGTMADYQPGRKFNEILVMPGNRVKVGQPIATVVPYQREVMFSVYFLEKDKLKEKMNPHSGLVPLFQTIDGNNLKLDFHKCYVAEMNIDMETQDMSKKEREKYIKNLTKNKK